MSSPPFPTHLLPPTDLHSFMSSPTHRTWTGPFTFICGADTQFGLIDQYHLKKKEPCWDKEVKLAKEAVTRINAMDPKPKFFVICGDMLDAFPYENGPTTAPLREKQYADFTQVFRDLDPSVKLVCVCGNHDIGDTPTEKTLEIYRTQFGPDIFSFWVGGVKFIVLNSQYFMVPDALPKETKRQMDFIEKELKEGSSAKHVVAFQHIPFFLQDPHEEKQPYFNLEKDFRLQMMDTLRKGGVRYVFCGHYHRNAGGFYKDLEQVVTSAVGCPLGEDPSGFRVVNVEEKGIRHEYVKFRKTADVAEI